MGDRYILTVTCPQCGRVDDDVYFAPMSCSASSAISTFR